MSSSSHDASSRSRRSDASRGDCALSTTGRRRALALAVLAGASPASIAQAADEVKPSPRGSWLSALLDRSSLSAFATKMDAGTITAAEVGEYFRMGGSVGRFERYDAAHAFFVGSAPVPVLNLFIRGPASLPRPLPADRLASLAALLAAGADPVFRIEDTTCSSCPTSRR